MRNDNISVSILPVLSNGSIDIDALKSDLQVHAQKTCLMNVTWVNNETGIVQNLQSILDTIKGKIVVLHVDGAQAIGKIPQWNELLPEVDAYTFSGHKFGALTGIGMTIFKEPGEFHALIVGGGQQNGLRGGTENVWGIASLRLALESTAKNLPLLSHAAKDIIENKLTQALADQIIIVGQHSPRNVNTINVIFKKAPSDSALIHFDLAGMDVSAGSACSSGRLKASHVLVAMGLQAWKSHGLRFSFSPQMSIEAAQKYATEIISVFQKI
jgi:cysteine desulfurase